MTQSETPRRRDAAATRAAILASARSAFARAGYDGVGVRDIAAGANVTAMMVNRYFGSKAALLEAVIEDAMENATIIRGDILDEGVGADALGRRLAQAVMAATTPGAAASDGFNILQRSAGNAVARALWREKIEAFHLKRLASALRGDRPTERAALMLAMVSGFQLMRQVIDLECLQPATSRTVEDALAAAFIALADPKNAAPA